MPAHARLSCQRHTQGLDGSGEARTWLLPLLRAHVSGAKIAFWASQLLPLARLCGRQAAAAAEAGPKRALAATHCRALELQLWATLPSFCSWPEDTDIALRCEVSQKAVAATSRFNPGSQTSGFASWRFNARPYRAAHCHGMRREGMRNSTCLLSTERRCFRRNKMLTTPQLPDPSAASCSSKPHPLPGANDETPQHAGLTNGLLTILYVD